MKTWTATENPANAGVFLLYNAVLVQMAARKSGKWPNAIVIAGPEPLLARFERLVAVRVEDGIVEWFAPTADYALAHAFMTDVVLWRYEAEAEDDVLTFRAGGVEKRVRIV